MNPAPGRIGLHADPPVAVTAGQARPLLVPWTLKNGSGSTLRFYHAGVAQQTLALLDHVVRYVLLQLACHACNRSHAGCDDSRPCKVRLVEKEGSSVCIIGKRSCHIFFASLCISGPIPPSAFATCSLVRLLRAWQNCVRQGLECIESSDRKKRGRKRKLHIYRAINTGDPNTQQFALTTIRIGTYDCCFDRREVRS
jgi:hypothetical protein